MIELDYGVGQILQHLKDLKLDKTTFAFFSSDNGAATYALDDGKAKQEDARIYM